jgi:hypothetical protein
MGDSIDIQCPHCGEQFSIAFDPSEGSTEFITDCEVCCRPMKISIGVDADGEIASLDVVEE